VPSIKLLQRAEFELFDTCEWYEKKQNGLSLDFRKEVRYSLGIIESNPLLYAKRYDTDLRFAIVKRFPFVIVFWFDEKLDTVFILSIFNTHRNPQEFNNP
jgi:hypothetical protein